MPVGAAEPDFISHRHMQAVRKYLDVHIFGADPEGEVDLNDDIAIGFCSQKDAQSPLYMDSFLYLKAKPCMQFAYATCELVWW